MARQSTEVQVIGAVLAFVLVGTLCGLWIYSDIRTTEATVDVLRASERAIERISAAPAAEPTPAITRPEPTHDEANARTLRDAASHAVKAKGLGSLIIGMVGHDPDGAIVSGTAVGRDDSIKVEVRLRERFGRGGRATYDQAVIRRL
jgi:hypothetical protein